jgi:hypothetical protein
LYSILSVVPALRSAKAGVGSSASQDSSILALAGHSSIIGGPPRAIGVASRVQLSVLGLPGRFLAWAA